MRFQYHKPASKAELDAISAPSALTTRDSISPEHAQRERQVRDNAARRIDNALSGIKDRERPLNPETKDISESILDFGLHALARSILDVTFAEIQNAYSHAMGVVRCAHAAEIIIKARIAQEHPLLIFTKLPRPKNSSNELLDIKMLLTNPRTRTLTYGELPDALWATTGYRIQEISRFESFGRLRNTIIHLGVPGGINFTDETYRFAYQIIIPMIRQFWDGSIAEYFGAYEDEGADYVQEHLDRLGL